VNEVSVTDVNSQTAVDKCERSITSVDGNASVNSPCRGSDGREKWTCPSPTRIPLITTTTEPDYSFVPLSPAKSVVNSEIAASDPVGISSPEVPLPLNRRRSLRIQKVIKSEDEKAECLKSAISPKHSGALLGLPVHQPPWSRSSKSPKGECIQEAASSNLLQSLRSSPRRRVSPSKDCGADIVSSGHGIQSFSADGDQHHSSQVCMSENISARKTASAKNVVASDSVESRQVAKTVDFGRDLLHVNNEIEGDKPLSTFSKQHSAVPDQVVLLFGTTQSDEQNTGVRNRRKLSYSSEPEAKQRKSRVKSLEPVVGQKSSRVGRPQRKSDIVRICDLTQNLPTPENSQRQLRMRKKPSSTPGDKALRSLKEKDSNVVPFGEESASSRKELRDGDMLPAARLDDLVAAKTAVVGIHNLLNNATPEHSGRQLRARRKPSIDTQQQHTPGDKEGKRMKDKDKHNLVEFDEESASSKKELRDEDVPSVTGLDDSITATASSDDVSTEQLLKAVLN